MHKFAKQIMECVKTKVEAMGIDNIECQHLEELEKWTEIAKNIVCYDKDYSIVEAIKESENDDNIRAIEMYEDYPERRYYDNYRYKTSGRFAPNGKGSYMPRRGYDEPPYYRMNPDMYREHTPEYYRDVDRENGRLYFSEPVTMNPGHTSTTGMRDSREGRSGVGRRNYMETKEMHKANTPEDKQAKMRELENYAKELTEDVVDMVADMSAEEKNLLRTKLQALAQKVS